MNKILIIIISILLAISIGIALSLFIGPMQLDGFDFSDIFSKDDDEADETDESVSSAESENVNEDEYEEEYDESEPQVTENANPIVGKWEVINLVDIDPHNMDEVGARIEFNEDGTGVEHHSEEPKLREMTWKTEGGRLTITPKDASLVIRTYDFETDNRILTIFFNRNRTSYSEAMRIP